MGTTIMITTHKIFEPPFTFGFLITLMSEYRLSNAHIMRKIKPKVPPIADVIRYIFILLIHIKSPSPPQRGWGETQ